MPANKRSDVPFPKISAALRLIFEGINSLTSNFPNRKFTIDGRLVGDIGEIIAALEYDIVLDDKSRPNHDGHTSDGRNVQIKTTFKDSLTFRKVPQYYLGLKLGKDGNYTEIFNGPGKVIRNRYRTRKGMGVKQLSFPIDQLQKLSQEEVEEKDRIPKHTLRYDKVPLPPGEGKQNMKCRRRRHLKNDHFASLQSRG